MFGTTMNPPFVSPVKSHHHYQQHHPNLVHHGRRQTLAQDYPFLQPVYLGSQQQYHASAPVSPGYASDPVPVQHHSARQHRHQQRTLHVQHPHQQSHSQKSHREQQQLRHHQTLANPHSPSVHALAGSFHNPNLQQDIALRPRPRQHSHSYHSPPMAYSMSGPSEDELAELEKLSSEYEPEVTGPLVDHRVPSIAITTEYANADPILKAKTADLPSKYAFYRKVRGDGCCGWRAIAFGYFETLAALGDPSIFLEEEGRLRSLGNIVKITSSVNFDNDFFDDITDEALGILRQLADAMRKGEDIDALLLSVFNDELAQNYVITYLKSLTTAWMKTRPEEYAPFLVGQTIQGYCDSMVMPIGAELENVSLTALKDVFVTPARISLEVVYLDRSERSEVNTHRFDPPTGPAIGTIRLLYRPGHYDIVYKSQDMPTQAVMPTFLQYGSQTFHEPVCDLGMSDYMTMMPGMSYANHNHNHSWTMTPSVQSQPFNKIVPLPQYTHSNTTTDEEDTSPSSLADAQAMHSLSPSDSYRPPFVEVGMPNSLHASFDSPASEIGRFRRSKFELEPSFVNTGAHIPLQTNAFKNSPHNPAHYYNDNFQPEMWHPEEVYGPPSNTKRHKANG